MDLNPLIKSIRNSQPVELEVNGTPVIAVPENYKLEQFPQLRDLPVRIEQVVNVQSVESFIDYYMRFATQGSTIFVDYEQAKITGVIDYHYHQSDTHHFADWCKHRVIYKFSHTPEADKWLNANGKKMTQADFANFIEDCAPEMIAPTSAMMLEIATTLSAKTGVDFRSHIRLDNGQVQFQYNETVQGVAGASGQITIPSKITIGVQLFRGSARYQMDANFRYRIEKGTLAMWFDLIRPNLVIDDAIKQVCEKLRAACTMGQIIEASAI